jgi:hypothetical protein
MIPRSIYSEFGFYGRTCWESGAGGDVGQGDLIRLWHYIGSSDCTMNIINGLPIFITVYCGLGGEDGLMGY